MKDWHVWFLSSQAWFIASMFAPTLNAVIGCAIIGSTLYVVAWIIDVSTRKPVTVENG